MHVADVAHMQFRSGEVLAWKLRRSAQCLDRFGGDDFRCLSPAVSQIPLQEWPIVEQLLFTIFEFFVVTKRPRVVVVKRLIADGIKVTSEIDVRKKERVKRDLAES